MTANEIRQSFLEFFRAKGHTIVPSAPVIPYDDPTLLFTNAGMNQFKDVFLGIGKRDYTRVADSQKCIRVSGKHNDLEEVGKDTYHHTFFEMLGNWSFGDYYKKEAIIWAWELLTDVWKLPKERLWATVYTSDDEAEECWKKYTDINPKHVLRFGEKDNFWEMGETGPCGPCSEIHIDLSEKGNIDASVINAGTPNAIEIWNLVFIQYNRDETGALEPLPAKHVDTGMGFERVVAILQGKKSNYDTDLFQPVIRHTEELTGKTYGTTTGSHLPLPSSQIDVSFRVIADHIRALTFAIADGAIPSNEGRGYVLRRILRRASRFGRNLGMHEPFIYKLVPTLVATMGDAYPEIKEKQTLAEQVIKGEEEGFNQTLDRGLEIFESVVTRIGHSKVFPGEDAFKLYDTYGFPLDLTELMAEERGLKVDLGRFAELMEEQRKRSRTVALTGSITPNISSALSGVSATGAVGTVTETQKVSLFVGYDKLVTDAIVQEIVDDQFIILSETPFYVESGGQVDDTGLLQAEGFQAEVVDLLKHDGRILHQVKTQYGRVQDYYRKTVRAAVDRPRREDIQRNHTATHIVHEALRRVLGTHLHQQGSLVAPDRLRFDFNHFRKVSPDEVRAIEDIVNEKIQENIKVYWEELPIEKAKKIPGVKMFFGEKYGEIVRVVFVDEKFSVEFCGGTHVRETRDIGLFKIVSEGSIASGIRRIEAVTGKGIDEYIEKQLLRRAGELDEELARLVEEKERIQKELGIAGTERPQAKPLRLSLGEISVKQPSIERIRELESTLREQETVVRDLAEETKSLKKDLSKRKVQQEVSNIDSLVGSATPLDGFKVVSARVEASTMEELKSIADTLRAKIGSGVGVLGAIVEEKVALVCVVTDDLIKKRKLQAGKIVSEVAKGVGGGGGGRPHLATAGGKEVEKLDDALRNAHAIVKAFLS